MVNGGFSPSLSFLVLFSSFLFPVLEPFLPCFIFRLCVDMPHLLHHRRRHSWPYCGPVPRSSGRQYVTTLTNQAPEPDPASLNYSHFVVPLVPADLHGQDDASSAGIIRPKHTSRAHRLWSTPKDPVANTSESHRAASLRQMVRPPLDKARSLFVLPTATTAAATPVARPTGNGMVSYLMPSSSSSPSPLPILPVQQPPLTVDNRGRMFNRVLDVERGHRRCHSERPRSWRQPSASLWTLTEE